MERMFLLTAAVFGLLGVAAGAFGAHLLKNRLSQDLLEVFEVAVRYQMYHALSLLAVGLLASRANSPALATAGYAFILGTLVFSGSLYLLVLTGQRWLGAITPLGGTALLVGWAALCWSFLAKG